MSNKPLVGISADRCLRGKHPVHRVGEKYIAAVAIGAGAVPVVIPALGAATDWDSLLDRCDGFLFTGSDSNVEPFHYGGPASMPGTLHDADRDATTLPLIPRAVAAGIPVLAICRGFQEMNVAYGGTLWQRVHELDGKLDHREDETSALEQQYGPVHDIEVEPGGWLERCSGVSRWRVNSLHSQGVQELAPGLEVEARAPDGLIEAFRVGDARTFAVGVQWHPEWKFQQDSLSQSLLAAFGAACRQRAASR
jgi:putative glutamine amidotransferase